MSSAAFLGFLSAIGCICCTNGFFMTISPCEYNVYVGQQDGIKLDISEDCHNGTIRWDYPSNYATITFPNLNGSSMYVCIQDYLGGDIFKFFDVTGSGRIAMPDMVTGGQVTSCSQRHTEAVVLQINAPSTPYYVGEVTYNVFN